MPDCSICCESGEKLYNLCSSCSGDDKLICAKCLAKMITFKGARKLKDAYIHMHIECPFCRVKIKEKKIREHEFGCSYQFYMTTSNVYQRYTQLLLEDRACLQAITQDHIIASFNTMRLTSAAREWARIRNHNGSLFDPNLPEPTFEETIESIFGNIQGRASRIFTDRPSALVAALDPEDDEEIPIPSVPNSDDDEHS